jgi:hypothetical protein
MVIISGENCKNSTFHHGENHKSYIQVELNGILKTTCYLTIV